jgi:hypothetical protein
LPAEFFSPPRARAGAFTAVCATLLAGLAGGALWCLLSLGIERGEGALVMPLAASIGLYFRWLRICGVRGALCAIVSILIAFVYAQYLFAAVRIAQMLGFSLRSTLLQMDAALAWQVARANAGLMDALFLGTAFVIAALIVWKAPPRASGGAGAVR